MDTYQIFISYRRDGGDALAGRFADRFNALGYKVFYDVESMRSGTFTSQILDAIAQCNDVLLVLPPNALDRCVNADDWVRQELAFALKHNKNIIPIMMRGFEFPATLPDDIDKIRYMEGVTASSEYFDAVIQRIETLLYSSKTKSNNTHNLVEDYISFISAITISDYHNVESFLKSNPNYQVTGGVFYICQKILDIDSLDDTSRKEFEQIYFVSKLLYKLAENNGYTDFCSLMRSISRDKYLDASTDIKQYLLQENENLQGEFIDLIWKSLSLNQTDSYIKKYWERILKEIFIWLKICSNQ